MITLDLMFVSGDGGFSADPLTYTQIARNDKVAVYERSRNGNVLDYEVFKIKISPKGKKIFATVLADDQEEYPSTSQFGQWAWSISGPNAKARALALMEELTKDASPAVEDEKGETTTVSVPVAKVTGGELKLPAGKFTHTQLAEANGKTNQQVYNQLQQLVKEGKIKFVGTQPPASGKGKSSKLFEKA
jgi:hypothetical protein